MTGYADITRYLHLAHTYRHAHHNEVENPRDTRQYTENELDSVISRLKKEIADANIELEKVKQEAKKEDEISADMRTIVASRKFISSGKESEDEAERIVKILNESEMFMSSTGLIARIDSDILRAKAELENEVKVKGELLTLNKLLEARLSVVQQRSVHNGSSTNTSIIDKQLRKVMAQRDRANERLRRLTVILKQLLDSQIAEALVEEENGAPVGGFDDAGVNATTGKQALRPATLDDHWTEARSAKIAEEAKRLVEVSCLC